MESLDIVHNITKKSSVEAGMRSDKSEGTNTDMLGASDTSAVAAFV
jgi:hypothetical protein